MAVCIMYCANLGRRSIWGCVVMDLWSGSWCLMGFLEWVLCVDALLRNLIAD